MTEAPHVPIAVVGMGAIMPGATDLASFWRCLVEGQDLITDVPENRWLVEDHYDPDPLAPDRTYCRRGAFLPEVDFDSVKYGIPPNALPATDTTHLLALLVADATLADMGELAEVTRERTSVILGAAGSKLAGYMANRSEAPVWRKALREIGLHESQVAAACAAIADHYVPWQESTFPGLLSNVVAGRIANRFDLHGTNCTVDAACASSMAALSMGIDELVLGRSDLVLTGGVDASNEPLMYLCFSKTPALSITGDCRPFSDSADGTMMGEGVAMFALTRLADAEAAGMRIHAVIRGLGASSDGGGGAIYAPVAAGQARAVGRAYAAAGYGPETVELVEAHGTGTSAGDAAEFAALCEVFDATGRQDRQWCALGSVKSQIGHTKCTAGAAGLLKAVLALQQKVLPPTIKVDRPDPRLDWAGSPLYLNTAARPWIAVANHPRRAGVSSFGFGGTNFHVTLEEYTGDLRARRLRAVPTELVLASGGTRDELTAQLVGDDLMALARRTQVAFDHTAPVRLAIVASSITEMRTKLDRAIALGDRCTSTPDGIHLAVGAPTAGTVGFLFPGQGSQYSGMGADLAMHLPIAQAIWDAADAADIAARVFPQPAFTDADRAVQERRLMATEWAQPALAMTSLVLLNVLRVLGLRPGAVAGHSSGELVALHAAGVFDAPTLLTLSRRRGELMGEAATEISGAMLAVLADPAQIDLAGIGDVWIANYNGPTEVVLSGTDAGIAEAEKMLTNRGVAVHRLNTASAFHSPLVAKAAAPFRKYLAGLAVSTPDMCVIGNLDASPYPTEADAIRDRLAEQIAAPVKFGETIEAMYRGGIRTFVEVGAGAILTSMVGRVLAQAEHTAIALDRRGVNGVTRLQDALGHLAVLGLDLDFGSLWDEPAPEGAKSSRPSVVIKIDGGHHGKRYPPAGGAAALPPPNPEPAAASAASTAAAVAPVAAPAPHLAAEGARRDQLMSLAPEGEWLRVIEASQRQAAHAHEVYQQTMADAHIAFLKLAEVSFEALAGQSAAPTPMWAPQTLDVTPAPGRHADIWQRPPSSQAPETMIPPAALAQRQSPDLDASHAVPASPAQPDPAVPRQMPGSRAEVVTLLLSTIADKTGYPLEVITEEMDLETDLGVDSIKRVEILAALRDLFPDLATMAVGSEQAIQFVTLRTVGTIVDKLLASDVPGVTVPVDGVADYTGPLSAIGEVIEDRSWPARSVPAAGWRDATSLVRSGDGDGTDCELKRRVTVLVEAPPAGSPLPGLGAGPIVITKDGGGVAEALAKRLNDRGVAATVVSQVVGDTRSVILLDGLGNVDSVEDAVGLQRKAFRAARTVAAGMERDGGVFVTVQDTGGDFGLRGADPDRAWLGGLAALTRSAHHEWPRVVVKAIDCDRGGRDAIAVADTLITELLEGGTTINVGLAATGARVTLEERDVPRPLGATALADPGVLVVTGGARGVTAAAIQTLATQAWPRMVLLGRTALEPEPDDVVGAADEGELVRLFLRRGDTPAVAKTHACAILAAREVRNTLAMLAGRGVVARYVAVDVRDRTALNDALAVIRTEWGPITGIVHGAGVLADRRIADKTDAQFDLVFDTKVIGLHALLAATVVDPLRFIVGFGSVVARFGNAGQCDYAMANETVTHVLMAEARRRPDCLVRSLVWGPWAGGMVTESLAAYFGEFGVPLIPMATGADAFCAELATRSGPVPVLLVEEGVRSLRVHLSHRTNPELADHAPAGVPVLPMAFVIDWFTGAARQWCPGRATVLKDLRVLRRVDLSDLAGHGHTLLVRGIDPGSAGDVLLTLELHGDRVVPCYRARVIAAGADDALLPGKGGGWIAPADLASVSDVYDGQVLFHGPRFRAIRSVEGVSLRGATGSVACVDDLDWGPGRHWNLDPAAVDGALQLALLWARQVLGAACLPMAVAECRLHRHAPPVGPLRCVVRAQQVRADEADCDVALLGPDETPVVELLGVTLVRRPL